ncbi:TetR/AcrR family transcriptional regulator [Pseudonocardia acaciae]|uniref:TetR/AcrR family transcriptional regulator n=1 Tax=Pseudonocardia acaciae TaxID=551276 RepID=UPI0004908ABF|nr:TetR/AcrR family transcriptional regulator [Pseudonocardia acaciae]
MDHARDRMIRAASALFRDRGYVATGFREVVERAGAARGSIYHHFPRGKLELAEEVVRWVGESVAAVLSEDVDPVRAVGGFVDLVAATLVRGELRPGCPVAAVAQGSGPDESRLRAAANEAFAAWQAALGSRLERAGLSAEHASDLATLAVASVEGALILCRARGDDEPLRRVGAQLERSIRQALDEA